MKYQPECFLADNVHLHRKLLRAGALEVPGTIAVLKSFIQMLNGNPTYFENVLPFEKGRSTYNIRSRAV